MLYEQTLCQKRFQRFKMTGFLKLYKDYKEILKQFCSDGKSGT